MWTKTSNQWTVFNAACAVRKLRIENYANYELIFNGGEFAHISPLCSHSEQTYSAIDRVLRVCCFLSKKRDRDHRVLGICCCDSKCSVAFQQTRHRHGKMQFSIAWWWRSGSVGQAFLSMPNYMYDRHMFSLWIVESLPPVICNRR